MKKTEKITIAELGEKEARELTVAEIAAVMDSMKEYQPHVLDLLMTHDVPVAVVMLSSGLDEEQLMGLSCSELDPLYEAVLRVNPNLAAMTGRLRKAVEKLTETPSASSPVSS